ncbi:MAG: hypothetical protein JWQ35_2110 [Bacteriovoracaceae bacterium]|nr:hypothetical protein [Bacteriovoracaceae bacterium]
MQKSKVSFSIANRVLATVFCFISSFDLSASAKDSVRIQDINQKLSDFDSTFINFIKKQQAESKHPLTLRVDTERTRKRIEESVAKEKVPEEKRAAAVKDWTDLIKNQMPNEVLLDVVKKPLSESFADLFSSHKQENKTVELTFIGPITRLRELEPFLTFLGKSYSDDQKNLLRQSAYVEERNSSRESFALTAGGSDDLTPIDVIVGIEADDKKAEIPVTVDILNLKSFKEEFIRFIFGGYPVVGVGSVPVLQDEKLNEIAKKRTQIEEMAHLLDISKYLYLDDPSVEAREHAYLERAIEENRGGMVLPDYEEAMKEKEWQNVGVQLEKIAKDEHPDFTENQIKELVMNHLLMRFSDAYEKDFIYLYSEAEMRAKATSIKFLKKSGELDWPTLQKIIENQFGKRLVDEVKLRNGEVVTVKYPLTPLYKKYFKLLFDTEKGTPVHAFAHNCARLSELGVRQTSLIGELASEVIKRIPDPSHTEPLYEKFKNRMEEKKLRISEMSSEDLRKEFMEILNSFPPETLSGH